MWVYNINLFCGGVVGARGGWYFVKRVHEVKTGRERGYHWIRLPYHAYLTLSKVAAKASISANRCDGEFDSSGLMFNPVLFWY